MARAPWAPEGFYAVCKRWVEDCLRSDGSLVAPGSAIWTKATIAEAAERMLAEDIRQGVDYITKLHDQLSGLSDAAFQFAAELLYVHVLPISNMGVPAKRNVVDPVLSWTTTSTTLSSELVAVLDGGVGSFGAGHMQRDRYIKYFVRVLVSWKNLTDVERSSCLEDPWSFRAFLDSLGSPAMVQREALLHVIHPDTFEYVFLPNDKARIARALSGLAPDEGWDNDDRALVAIRESVERALDRPLNLYAPWFQPIWKGDASERWDAVVHWGRRLLDLPDFDAQERDYKFVVAERMAGARDAMEGGEADWLERLRHAFSSPNNLTHWQFEHGPFLTWCDKNPDDAREFLRAVWGVTDIDTASLDRALEHLPASVLSGSSARLTLASVLLFAVDVTRFPPYRARAIGKFRRLAGIADGDGTPSIELEDRPHTPNELAALLGVEGKRFRDFLRREYPRETEEHGKAWELTADQALAAVEAFAALPAQDLGEVYGEFANTLDELRMRFLADRVELRDRLDAQGIAWWLGSAPPPEDWSDEDKVAFERFRGGEVEEKRVTEATDIPDRAWLVRGANVDGVNLVPEWVQDGYVSIGWHEMGDLDSSLDRQQLKEKVQEVYPDDSAGAWRAAAGNLHRFLNVMKPGHLVLTADGDKLYVGRIDSNATSLETGMLGNARRRSVVWLNAMTPASRAAVQTEYPSLYSKLRTLLTVTDLREEVASVAALAGLTLGLELPRVVLPRATDELGKKLHLPVAWLQSEVLDLLAEKGQVVFYGPPGTGKTYVAKAIATHIIRDGGEFAVIQFHPSYSYEDFFEGYRPAQSDAGVGVTYELTPGPLRRIAEAAKADPSNPYVLIIDELNRGNVPKIFGELLFLLEYRDEEIPLQYSPHVSFGLPKNLFLIGTMNTADRSIALVDAALRRRFYFVAFMAHEEPIRGVLGKWLEANEIDDEAARLMHALNERIATGEIAIGPSYFMTREGAAPDLERVWRHAVLPVLEEHFYGTGRDIAAEFGLDALRSALRADSTVEHMSDGGGEFSVTEEEKP